MPNLIELTDFVGSFEIAKGNYTDAKFEPIRDEKQFELIYKVMGAELGALFIADLDANGEPQTQIYIDLYDAFQSDDGCDGLIISEGIKKMVTAYVYFYWCGENKSVVDMGANTQKLAENSTRNYSNQFIVSNYNRAVKTAHAIQWYIGQNSADYPTYSGKEIEYMMLF